MWSFQLIFPSTSIPKNFIDEVLLISKLFIFRIGSFIGKLSLSQDLRKRVNFVLLNLRKVCLLEAKLLFFPIQCLLFEKEFC